MSREVSFEKGDTLLHQGEEDTFAYLIRDGWLEVIRTNGKGAEEVLALLGPGEIVGELGLAGKVNNRSASVKAVTDGEAEVIDRAALIRLVNGPGDKLVPLLSALFNRLQTALLQQQSLQSGDKTIAWLEGTNDDASRALCNRRMAITHLPWVFGAFQQPRSVTDLFKIVPRVDVRLVDHTHAIRDQHVLLEKGKDGVQLRLSNKNDFCLLDGEPICGISAEKPIDLTTGEHQLVFGKEYRPFKFTLEIAK